MDEIKQISIVNSEYGKPFNLYVRSDRLKAFYRFMINERHPEYKSNPMPGVSWAAVMGLDAVFARRPKKFPVNDILLWLSNDCIPHSDFPRITKDEVEYALERFSAVYPPDASEDA